MGEEGMSRDTLRILTHLQRCSPTAYGTDVIADQLGIAHYTTRNSLEALLHFGLVEKNQHGVGSLIWSATPEGAVIPDEVTDQDETDEVTSPIGMMFLNDMELTDVQVMSSGEIRTPDGRVVILSTPRTSIDTLWSIFAKSKLDIPEEYDQCYLCGQQITEMKAVHKAEELKKFGGKDTKVLCCDCVDKLKIVDQVIDSGKYKIVPIEGKD